MSDAPLVVIGDALLDRDVEGAVERLAPDAPVPVLDERAARTRPGGAALAAALAAAEGRPVTLVTALSGDGAGVELAALIAACGVELVDLGLDGPTPEKVRLRTAAGQPLLRLDRGGPGSASAVGRPNAAARAAIGWASAVLVADYGRGVAAEPGIRAALAERIAAGDRVPVAWDPHPRGPAPLSGVLLAMPNEREAAAFAPEVEGEGLPAVAGRAASLRCRWGAEHVCVTRGRLGALLDGGDGPPLSVPAEPAADAAGDPCGAGDRFAAAAAAALADGARCDEAVIAAVAAASRFVAAGGAASVRIGHGTPRSLDAAVAPDDAIGRDAAEAVAAATRARGGVVVATGGCFDLLHAGHVRTLEAARALGDCLVVGINDDASVRRLKGPARPLVPARDRAAVLAALRCVDAVVTFSEDTPTQLLERLRPDVWAKGGDYAGAPLPEAEALERWGGRAVVLPHHAGHSTTRLIEEAANRAAS